MILELLQIIKYRSDEMEAENMIIKWEREQVIKEAQQKNEKKNKWVNNLIIGCAQTRLDTQRPIYESISFCLLAFLSQYRSINIINLSYCKHLRLYESGHGCRVRPVNESLSHRLNRLEVFVILWKDATHLLLSTHFKVSYLRPIIVEETLMTHLSV